MTDRPRAGAEPGSIAVDSTVGRSIIATTVAGSAIVMLTGTVVNVAIPAIADDLSASSSEQQWVVNAYLVTLASLILIGGSLGDRYGRVRTYRIGVVWFAVASVGCAIAPSIELLVAARLVQGIGGALLTPGSLAIIESTLVADDRSRGVGVWSGLSGIAAAVGPPLGGVLVDLSWRWIFVVNLPVAAAVLLASRRVPETLDDDQQGPLDVTGAALTMGALAGTSFVLVRGGSGGVGPLDAAAVAVAVASGVALALVERRRRDPLLPLDLLVNRTFVAVNAVTLLVYGGMGVVFFLLPIQLQVGAGWSALEAGTALLPVTALMLVLSSRSGELAQRIGPRWPLTVGPVAMAAGMALLIRIDRSASFVADVLPAVTTFGLGLAVSVAPVTATALAAVPDGRAGAASGVNNAVSRTGQLLAVAAVPPLVGLTGPALSEPASVDAAFGPAMLVGAALVLAGGIAGGLLVPSGELDDLRPVTTTSATSSTEPPNG